MTGLKTIGVLAYLTGPAGRAKCAYFEALDAELRREGYRLLLIEQGGGAIGTACDTARLPEGAASGELPLPEAMEGWQFDPALGHAAETDAGFHGIPADDAARRCLGTAWHAREILRREGAVLCMLWHQFNGACMALAELCRRDDVPRLFTHLGPLPGTIVFEAGGQMAESWVCRENERFRQLPVTREDLDRAEAYLAHLRAARADRKPQTAGWSIADAAARLRARTRHILFYAGQNDFRSGMAPRSLPNARLHSPLFDSTGGALQVLAHRAEEADWGILFKPHPNLPPQPGGADVSPRVTPVPGANIFECILESEATVTILSAAAYLALIHEKPAVLLGRMPLSGKGCAYAVDALEQLVPVIEEACTRGFTPAQRAEWVRHCAQLIRHYLFAYDPASEERIGCGPGDAARFILSTSHRRRGGD